MKLQLPLQPPEPEMPQEVEMPDGASDVREVIEFLQEAQKVNDDRVNHWLDRSEQMTGRLRDG